MLQGQINLALGKLCHMKFNRAKTRTELIQSWLREAVCSGELPTTTLSLEERPTAKFQMIGEYEDVRRLKGRFHILSFDIIPVATCASELVCGGSATFRLGRDTTALGGSSIALQVAAEPFFFFSVDVQVPSMLHVRNEIDIDVKITESGQCQSVCSPSDQVGSALCLFALDLLLTCFDLTCF